MQETSSKALEEKKIKVARKPKLDLKTYGEGKDLNYELQIDCLPNVTLKSFDKLRQGDSLRDSRQNLRVEVDTKVEENTSLDN